MWVMMTYPHSFPNIDNSGVVLSPLSTTLPVTGGKLHTITWTGALDEFAVRYPKNFGIQNNGLSDFFVWPEVYNRAANSPRGYQMLMNVTGDSTFAMNNGVHVPPGPPATVPDILAGAISLGVSPGLSQFQEIYSSDILNAAMVSVLTAGRASILGVP